MVRPSAAAIHKSVVPLTGESSQYDSLLRLIGDSRLALIGEASHGTHEFYQERAEITKRLIVERRFNAVAVEADWPDAYRVNRYVRSEGGDPSAEEALSGFERFPTWMWRNSVVVEFVEWLRDHNRSKGPQEQVGFYGLDLYSLFTSIDEVLRYLDRIDPEAARVARSRYACFDHFGEDTQAYGYAASFNLSRTCEDEVVNQLVELRRNAAGYANRDGFVARGEYFHAEQNARLVLDAEQYYREMFRGRISSWNLRDRHMAETLEALLLYLEKESAGTRIAVWEHNSHIGDARATEMGEAGELNVGQLVRERHGDDAVLIGFSTYEGTVTAASDWGGEAERKRVRPGLRGSWEEFFHQAGEARFLIPLKSNGSLRKQLPGKRLQRAIGVIYLPRSERRSHYFHATLTDQFDAMIHIEQTSALHPLEKTPRWVSGEPPETYPTGI